MCHAVFFIWPKNNNSTEFWGRTDLLIFVGGHLRPNEGINERDIRNELMVEIQIDILL